VFELQSGLKYRSEFWNRRTEEPETTVRCGEVREMRISQFDVVDDVQDDADAASEMREGEREEERADAV